MKGPLAASIVAASQVNADDLESPIFIAVTADEEIGHGGAKQIATESATLASGWPKFAVVCEPSLMTPVYAHKGAAAIIVTAQGVAAHSSTDKGDSANFKIAPFLAEMAEIAAELKTDPHYQNDEFDPPTNGFNMVMHDGGTAPNVTAAKSECTVCFRPMPDSGSEELVKRILERAKAYGFDVSTLGHDVFYSDRNSTLARTACELTGHDQAITVPYGTEAVIYQNYAETIVMGPGDIAQAHTVGEYIEIRQLERAVEVYGELIDKLCR
jgi:acetylornithine deacetylase